jgi:hypothetical protein
MNKNRALFRVLLACAKLNVADSVVFFLGDGNRAKIIGKREHFTLAS